MGCCLGLPDAITAITFVALGTSMPDTFASGNAAQTEPYADACIVNITGSNSVNVFLGLGLPWMCAAVYWSTYGQREAEEKGWRERYRTQAWYTDEMAVGFAVQAGDLGFSVGVFSCAAVVCLGVILLRRRVHGVELGGPMVSRVLVVLLFVALWIGYIVASSLSSYGMLNDLSQNIGFFNDLLHDVF